MREQLTKLFGLGDLDKSEEVRNLPLGKIKMNPFQPRVTFDENSMLELTESVKKYGVIQPIIVRRIGEYYELVAGERRYRAAKAANLLTIPAIVKPYSDEDVALIALIENLQRQDLNFIEEAESYRKLIKEFGFTQEELAKKVGKSQAAVANKLRILQLPPQVLEQVAANHISERHARALLRLKDLDDQIKVISQVINMNLTVLDTEKLIEEMTKDISREINPEAAALHSGGKKRQKVKKVIRNIRIYLNSIESVLQEMERAGLAVEKSVESGQDELEIHIRVKVNSMEPGKKKAVKSSEVL